MTYASYLKSQENLGREAATVALADFGVAFAAGLVIFPIIFHFGLTESIGLGEAISDNTVGTLFIALPTGLQSLGRFGDVIVAAFFVMLFFAALTSAISLLEVVVAALIDAWSWTRARAAVIFGILIIVFGIPSAIKLAILNAADKFVGNFLLVVGGFFISILVGYRLLPQADAELARGMDSTAARRAWAIFVRYVAPVVLILVIGFTLVDSVQAIRTLFGAGG